MIHQAGKMVEVFDGLSKTTEVTATAMKAAGSAANEVRVRLETAEVSVNRFKAGFENLGIAIGLEFLEATKEAVRGGSAIEETLQNVVKGDTFDPVFSRIRSFGEEFGDFLEGIAAAMPEAFEKVEFEGLLTSLDNLKGSFKGTFQAIFGDLDLTKPEDLAKAIQKVVDTITTLTNITGGIIDRINPLIEMFVNWTGKVNDWDTESQKAFGNRLADAMIIEKFGGIVGSVLIGLTGDAKETHEAMQAMEVMGDPFAKVTFGAEDAADAIGEIPGEVDALKGSLADMGPVDIVDPKATETDLDEVYRMMVDAAGKINEDLKASGGAKVPATADEESINQVKTILDQKIPKERKVEVDLEKERIKAQAEIITATIEAETEKWKTMFESVNTGIESTGDVLKSFWETLAGGNLDIGQTMEMERYIEEENDRRRQEFELQRKLTEQQIDLNRLKIDALSRGDALITIDGSGLQPHLEGFMWEVLESIQVRANATGAEFLLGIS